jgi:hypothetical protein
MRPIRHALLDGGGTACHGFTKFQFNGGVQGRTRSVLLYSKRHGEPLNNEESSQRGPAHQITFA